MKKTIYTLLFLLVGLVAFNSCKKEVEGPQGPAGKDGNANIETHIVSVKASDWQYDNLYSQWYFQYKIGKSFPVNSFVISSYQSANGYQQMPYSDQISNYDFNVSENLTADSAVVELQCKNKTLATDRPNGNIQFKLSIVPVQ